MPVSIIIELLEEGVMYTVFLYGFSSVEIRTQMPLPMANRAPCRGIIVKFFNRLANRRRRKDRDLEKTRRTTILSQDHER